MKIPTSYGVAETSGKIGMAIFSMWLKHNIYPVMRFL